LVPVYLYRTFIPTDEHLNQKHQETIDEKLAEIKVIQSPIQGSNRLLREVLAQTPVSERLIEIEQSKANHAEFMDKVSKQRPVTVAKLTGGWIALCGLLYIAGLVGAWIARGFRKPLAG